jgi:hypothetical protein
MECAFGAVEIAADAFALLGIIAGELAVLPRNGKAIKIQKTAT